MSDKAKKKGTDNVFPEGYKIGNYTVYRHLGHGGYGNIYSVLENQTRKEYALKYEHDVKDGNGLVIELEILNFLQPSRSFPKLFYDSHVKNDKYAVIELLGPSLSNLRRQLPGRHYSKESATFLAFHTLCCVEELHANGIVNRDVKPGNFLVRADWENPICMIDFGLSYFYIDEDGKHVPFRKNRGFIGTCKYASINSHEKYELSRRDDMISWFYSCIEFYNGKLPWPASKDKAATLEKKKQVTREELLSKLPDFYEPIYDHIFSLNFSDTPNYKMMKETILPHVDQQCQMDWEKIDPEILTKLAEVNFIPNTPRTPVVNKKDFVMPDSPDYNGKPIVHSPRRDGCCMV